MLGATAALAAPRGLLPWSTRSPWSAANNRIVDRHKANGQRFEDYVEKPGFREAFLRFLATSYDDIRGAVGA